MVTRRPLWCHQAIVYHRWSWPHLMGRSTDTRTATTTMVIATIAMAITGAMDTRMAIAPTVATIAIMAVTDRSDALSH